MNRRKIVVLGTGGTARLVVAGTGNGAIHRQLEQALRTAHAAGVKVVRATRCVEGPVLGHAEDPFASAHGLSPVKARIALQLELMAGGLIG